MIKLHQKIQHPHSPLPWQWFDDKGLRQVVMVIVFHQNGAMLLTQPVKDQTATTWIPIQGGCEEGETVLEAARREARGEVVSFARPKSSARWRLLWPQARYLGSASNPHARSGRPSDIHVVGVQAVCRSLKVDPVELRSAQWIYSPEVAEAMLEPTRHENPIKYGLVVAGVQAAVQAGIVQ